MHSRKLRVGLIGCGRISKNHFEVMKKLNHDLELVAVCDIEKEKFKKLEEINLQPKCYTNYEAMLSERQLDLMVLCTPSGLHPEHGIAAAKHKVNVLSEKPMGTTLEAADKLIKECQTQGVKLFVVKQNRLNRTVQYLKKAIETGRFGKIYQVITNVLWTRPQSYYDADAWRGRRDLDGGAFLNQASHYVDLMYYLFGEVKSVYAVNRTLARKIEMEDSGVAAFEFKNGIIGSMNVSMLTYPKNYEGSVTVIGEKGLVKVGGVALNKIEKWDFSQYHDMDKEIAEANYEPVNVYGVGHLPYYQKLIDHMRGKGANFVDGAEGRKSLEVILNIYKSAETGKPVLF
ncbi:MAG: Gfo/Idh/MocA family oxidoreductase [Elusimicrobia bacterium]|nr:Gfo/Idh/MocA family oxidoreductase [Elusimicrobiota bacterium]